MPRLTKCLPKYRKHKASGQAVVTLDGKDFYLGPHNTSASKREYDRVVGEWQSNGRRLPAPVDETTVVELAAAFWRHAKLHYVKSGRPTDEQAGIRVCLRYLKQFCGALNVAEFGPLALKSIRQQMIDAGNSRRYINQNTSRIKHIFKWGVENELVPSEIFWRISTVQGLQEGKTEARESEPVASVEARTVDSTVPHLPQVVADMVRIQMLTGMRPGEVVLMRPVNVDRLHDVWTYRPMEHKMEHKQRARVVHIGPRAQAILLPYLLRESDAFCFVPKRRSKAGRYTVRTYRNAVHRACRQANLSCWNPNQLRHTAGTEIRKQFGLEAAQVTLGHSNANVTQIYAERDMERAAAIMREVG